MTEDYTFDPQTGLLTNQKATRNGTPTPLLDLSYEYNRNNAVGTLNGKTGHLTKIVNNLDTQKNREYEFDVLGRLTMAKGGSTGTLWTQTYTYDRWGNRTNVAKTGTAAGGGTMPLDGIPSLTYDNNSNRISTSGYQYDVNGNQTKTLAEDGSTWVRYEYDSANRLWLVKRDSDGVMLQRFGYGATNARFQSLDALANIWTLYAAVGGSVLAEYTEFTASIPSWTKSYTYMGGSQLSTITKNGSNELIEYNHPDRLGTKLITNQTGGTSYEQAHLPFGRPLDAESSGSTAQRFTTYERSAITKLDYAINRTYDSKLGRFTQVDPIGMQAVGFGSPQTLNMYAYCINDPVNYTDPTGLFLGSFFRWLGRVLLGLSRSRVARRIAIKFVINYALSGGNFGVAIRSVIPDILQSTGIFPDPRSTVPWYPGSRLPISLGTSSLSKYIIKNLVGGPLTRAFCKGLEEAIDAIRPIADDLWRKSKYGTPDAWEYSARITYKDGTGWFANDIKRGRANMLQYGTRWRDGTPRGTYARPQDQFYDVFDIHTHPFDSGQQLKIKGNHALAGQVGKLGDMNQPSIGSNADTGRLDPRLIGLIVTTSSIVVYTGVGRRCRFNR